MHYYEKRFVVLVGNISLVPTSDTDMICEIKNGLFFVSAFIEQRQRFLFGVGCHYATDTKSKFMVSAVLAKPAR
jgi:hypothetical protein